MTVVKETTQEEIETNLPDSETIEDGEVQLGDGEETLNDVVEEGTEELSPAELLKKLEEKDTALEAEREKNKKLYEKFKTGQKKGIKTREELKNNYISKDELRASLEEIRAEEKAEAAFKSKYDDVDDLMPEIKKTMEEDGLSLEKAYFVIKGKLTADEGYRNQLLGERTQSYGTHTVSSSTKQTQIDKILSDVPDFAKPRSK